MAEDLDDGEFWLPSQFLTDDILLDGKDRKNHIGGAFADGVRVSFPSEFPYGASSALSSPVESVVSSTETESDEDDPMAGLTLQMARSMLQEHGQSTGSAFGTENSKAWVLSGSPQSTLCAFGSLSARSAGSSRGSPNGPSQVCSPPSTPMNGKDDAWDLLYAAAGQVVRMKMNDEPPKCYQGRGLLGPPRKPASNAPPLKNPNVGMHVNQSFTTQHLQSNQHQLLKQQQIMKQQQQQCFSVWGKQGKVTGASQQQVSNRAARPGGFGIGRCGRPLDLSSSAWPPLQPQPQSQHPQPQTEPHPHPHHHHHNAGSGMRAVFLGGGDSRRESSGTGVFLPRRIGSPAEFRKKPACSTVLVPARVVQALNLSFDEMGTQPRFAGAFSYEHGNNAVLCQQKRSVRTQAGMDHEIRLPSDWTY